MSSVPAGISGLKHEAWSPETAGPFPKVKVLALDQASFRSSPGRASPGMIFGSTVGGHRGNVSHSLSLPSARPCAVSAPPQGKDDSGDRHRR